MPDLVKQQKRAAAPLGLALSLALFSCGRAGDSPVTACSLCGSLNDVRGEIATQSGSQSQMEGWVVASFEHDTGIARVGEVDSAGIFTLGQMRTDHIQTLALLTPDYILQAVLSIPGTVDKTIRQYVQFQDAQMPHLINDGPIITFADLSSLAVQDWTASDQAGKGIPDGVAKLNGTSTGSSSLNLASQATAKTIVAAIKHPPTLYLDAVAPLDRNGIPNNLSPDVDGDGLINWLDPDDNGNGTLDIFDPDQNSDLINDLTPAGHNTDQWFQEGVSYFSAQFTLQPKSDRSGNQTMLTFTTQILSDVSPIAVQIRGAPSLLNNATIVSTDSTGAVSSQAWDKTLVDDGSGSRTFTRQVVLANAVTPSPFEVVFLELVFGTSTSPWYIDFPWTFPSLSPAAITAQYDSNTHNVQLVGNPYGRVQDFLWTINVYNSSGNNIWTSQAIPGSTRQFAVQSNILQAGQTYKYAVSAVSYDKIPGHPAFAIFSPQYAMQ